MGPDMSAKKPQRGRKNDAKIWLLQTFVSLDLSFRNSKKSGLILIHSCFILNIYIDFNYINYNYI